MLALHGLRRLRPACSLRLLAAISPVVAKRGNAATAFALATAAAVDACTTSTSTTLTCFRRRHMPQHVHVCL